MGDVGGAVPTLRAIVRRRTAFGQDAPKVGAVIGDERDALHLPPRTVAGRRSYCLSAGGILMMPTPFSMAILVPKGLEYSTTSSRIIFATAGDGRFGIPI